MDEKAPAAELPSVWPGLWGVDLQGPYLTGGHCKSCGHTTLEVRRICPSCWSSGTMEATPIGREGTLYTYTVIHQPPPGFDAPFAVGYVDLAKGVRIFAHLERSPETLRIGSKLNLAIEPLKKSEDGTVQYGPQYGAASPSTGAR